MKKKLLLTMLCTALAAAAQVPCRWTVDLSRVTSADWTAFRGETLLLEPEFVSAGGPLPPDPSATWTLYWQTNGMGSAWWSAPASAATGRHWRVAAVWSPANDVGANAYSYFIGGAATNGMIQYRAHGTIRMRGAPGAAPNALPLPVKVIDFADVSVTNAPWALPYVPGDNIVITNGVISSTATGGGGGVAEETDPVWAAEKANYADMQLFAAVEAMALSAETGANIAMGRSDAALALAQAKVDADDLGSAAYRDAAEFATAADEQLLYQLVMGSNVVFEVTNYNSRVRAPTMRLQQLDPDTREYFTVWAETNGLTRTLAAANGYTDAASNALDRAKADRAWSRYTSGLGADAPDGVTWVSTPQAVIAGGYEYAKIITTAGEAWVLTSNGLVTGADTNAYFKVSAMDGEEIFSIAKTDAVLVGVDAASISVSGNTVTIPVNVVSETAPVCMATDDLAAGMWNYLTETPPPWIESAEVTGESGAWVWTITTDSPRGFFRFEYLRPGGTVIRHHAPTDLSQGILVGNRRFMPVVTGDTLTWEAAQ